MSIGSIVLAKAVEVLSYTYIFGDWWWSDTRAGTGGGQSNGVCLPVWLQVPAAGSCGMARAGSRYPHNEGVQDQQQGPRPSAGTLATAGVLAVSMCSCGCRFHLGACIAVEAGDRVGLVLQVRGW